MLVWQWTVWKPILQPTMCFYCIWHIQVPRNECISYLLHVFVLGGSIYHCICIVLYYYFLFYIHCESKNHQPYYTCINLKNVGQFSKFFYLWIQQEICNKTLIMFPTTYQLCSRTTLWNLKCHFYHYRFYKNIHRNLFIFIFICPMR